MSLNEASDISAAHCERAVIRQRHAIVLSNDDSHLVNFQATNVPPEAVILLCVLPLVTVFSVLMSACEPQTKHDPEHH